MSLNDAELTSGLNLSLPRSFIWLVLEVNQ